MTPEPRESRLYNSNKVESWSSLWSELLQSELTAPADIDPRDIQFERRAVIYRLMLLLMGFALMTISLEGLVVYRPVLTFAAVIGLVASAATFIRVYTTKKILLPPIVMLTYTFAVVLAAIAEGGVHHTLLLFPLMIALAGLVPTNVALVLGIAVVAVLLVVRGGSLASTEMAVYSAIVATWLLSLGVMRLLSQQADELADLALTDPLTGALNRRYLYPQAERNLADFKRYARLTTLVMIDIDHFKQINDRFGHDVGDDALQAVVSLIDDRIRGVDMLYRLGGEEFVIMLAETGALTASKVADELRVGISQLDVLPEGNMTVSMGVCDVTVVGSAEEWLRKVDEALYQAKSSGRNRVVPVATVHPTDLQISPSMPVWR